MSEQNLPESGAVPPAVTQGWNRQLKRRAHRKPGPRSPEESVENCRYHLASLYRAARAGRMDALTALRLATIVNYIVKAHEVTTLEKRLDEVERLLLAGRDASPALRSIISGRVA